MGGYGSLHNLQYSKSWSATLNKTIGRVLECMGAWLVTVHSVTLNTEGRGVRR